MPTPDIYAMGLNLAQAVPQRRDYRGAAIRSLFGSVLDPMIEKKLADIQAGREERAAEKEFGRRRRLADYRAGIGREEAERERKFRRGEREAREKYRTSERMSSQEHAKMMLEKELGSRYGPGGTTARPTPSSELSMAKAIAALQGDIGTAQAGLEQYDLPGIGPWEVPLEDYMKRPEAEREPEFNVLLKDLQQMQQQAEVLRAISARYGMVPGGGVAPGATPPIQPAPQDLPPGFESDPEGTTYNDPQTGQRAVKRGGRLVPIQ